MELGYIAYDGRNQVSCARQPEKAYCAYIVLVGACLAD